MRSCLLIFLLSASCVATAQTFKEGSVRLNGGQDRPGLIGELRSGLPEGIEYKASSDSTTQILYANEIEGYTVDRIFYSSYHQNGYREREWVFAEILAEGDLTLIRRNNMYFLRKKSSVEFTHLSGRYRQVLSKLTKNCPIVSARAGSIDLDKKSVGEFIKEYNECVASKNPNLEGMPRVVSIGVQMGYDYTMAKFKDNVVTRYLSASNQSDKSYFQGGLEFNFKSYRFSKVIGFYTGALLNSNSYSGTNRSTIDPKRPEVNQYSFSYKEFKVPLGFDISRPTRKKAALHIRGGIMMPFTLSLKANHLYSEVSNGSGTSVYYAEPSQIKSYKPNVMLGGALGYDFKISSSHIRAQVGWYRGSVQVTSIAGGVQTKTNGHLSSYNFMMTYIF